MKTTLQDIARRCKVDVSTVSRALRGDPQVKPRTRKTIAQVAAELDYHPNLAARSLVAGRTHTIWMIVPTLVNFLEREPCERASVFLREAGYDLLVSLYGAEVSTYEHLIQRLDQCVADGAIIIAGLDIHAPAAPFRNLLQRGFPFVFLDRHTESVPAPVVTTDNETGARHLARACVEHGARQAIVHFGAHNPVDQARCRGAVAELQALGCPTTIVNEGVPPPSCATVPQPLALLASSQDTAGRFLSRHAAAVRRPQMIGIFDDWYGEPNPGETVFTCVQDSEHMTQLAVNHLLDLIQGKATLHHHITRVPPREYRTIERRS